MNRILALALSLTFGLLISLSGQAQSKKGPFYKNASISEKHDGTSVAIMRVNPTELKGPEAKNYKPQGYDFNSALITASLKDNLLAYQPKHKVVDLDEAETKLDKGLKGPFFKNYKPGR